jgi:SAM-dependent methyltransferase
MGDETVSKVSRPEASPYDSIARLYDPWSRSVTEDVDFYVDLARGAIAPIVELGVGTGRIAIKVAQAGVPVIGVDDSPGMLEMCRRRAVDAGVASLVDLRLGDMRSPPVEERVGLVMCPFRAYLHLLDDRERLEALGAARELLIPGGWLAFDVFAPGPQDIDETHGRWIEREPGIYERADWNLDDRTLTLGVRGDGGETTMQLAWLSPPEWRLLIERAGFELEAVFGWFDRRPYTGGEDTIWIARRPD